MRAENPEKISFVLGVSISGSHINAAVVNLQNRKIVEGTWEKTSVNAQGTAAEILDVWYETINQAVQKSPVPVKCMGIAMPGLFDYETGVSYIRYMKKYDSLYEVNVKEFLALKLSLQISDIKMRNDAEAFLAGEVMEGAAAGYKKAIGITLGAGLGSARSKNGVTEDVNLGSSMFLNGIAEDYLSSRWFIKRYKELSGNSVKWVKEILQVGAEDKCVQRLFSEFSNNLAHFLGGFIINEKPDVVVIGGYITDAYDLFYPQVSKLLERHLDKVVIRKALLGESAALLGAVSFWMKNIRPVAGIS